MSEQVDEGLCTPHLPQEESGSCSHRSPLQAGLVPSMGEPESFSAPEEHQAGEKAPQTHSDSW